MPALRFLSRTDIRSLIQKIQAWHQQAHRPFPWRHAPPGQRDPYQVWIAEVMAQQTRVSTIVPYYERWMRRFPDIPSVAHARTQDILKVWEGLGYYRRALNIHRAARIMVQRHAGQVPSTRPELLALPGIGRYTAGGILSLAFNQPEPAVDGNVVRLFSRLHARPYTAARKADIDAIDSQIREILQAVPDVPPGLVAEALMGLGSSVCQPRIPRCHQCPMTDICLTWQAPEDIPGPARATRRELPERHFIGLILTAATSAAARVLLVQHKTSEMLGGLWGFPALPVAHIQDISPNALQALARGMLGLELQSILSDVELVQDYSHFRRRQQIYRAVCVPGMPDCDLWSEARWVRLSAVDEFPLSVLDQKIARTLSGPASPVPAGKPDSGSLARRT